MPTTQTQQTNILQISSPEVRTQQGGEPAADADAEAGGDPEFKHVSQLSLRDKKLIRKYRFVEGKDGEIGTSDAQEILKKINEEKQKRNERALKYGMETKDMLREKK